MQPYLDVLTALSRANVRFVVVGGVAVALHGHLRATVDIDLVIDLVPANAMRTIDVLTGLGLRPRLPVEPRQFADEEIRRDWVENRNLMVFSMWHPQNPSIEIDLFAAPPIDPEEMLADAYYVTVGELQIPVASRAHLIEMKRLAGRAQDLADIEALSGDDDE